MADSLDRAFKVYQKAQPQVRVLILAEAEKRVQTNIGRVDSLNQRLSALCALLFAGAAVAATLTTNTGKLPPIAIYIACGSAVFFAIGGAIGCWGLFSRQSVFPGEKASWWDGQGVDALAQLNEQDANGWLIERSETMIDSLALSVERRALAFNIAVVLGAVGGVLIAVAALAGAVFGAPASSAQNLASTVNTPVDTVAAAQLALGRQQMLAAWIAGVAAAVQAIGAVAALFLNIKFARDAVKREVVAQEASARRELAAEAAAAERELRAAELEKLRAIEKFNQPIDRVLGLGRAAVEALEAEIREFQATFNSPGVISAGPLDLDRMREVRIAVDSAEISFDESSVVAALSAVRRNAEPINPGVPMSKAQRVDFLSDHRDGLAQALSDLKKHRR